MTKCVKKLDEIQEKGGMIKHTKFSKVSDKVYKFLNLVTKFTHAR